MSDYASLCVLSYNRPNLLQASLATLRENADYPYELIVHDDGSTDQQLLDYLTASQRAGEISTLILNPPGHNQGQGVALNRMFGMATGDPIIKLDHDLLYERHWLRHVVQLLDANERRYEAYMQAQIENYDPATCDPEYIGLLGLLHYWHEPVHSAETLIDQFSGWSSHTHILGSAFALRRETWEALRPFAEHSPAFAEDADMQRRVTESGRWVCGLPRDQNGRPLDFVSNVGMGYGPSTVNVKPGVTQPINTAPRRYHCNAIIRDQRG